MVLLDTGFDERTCQRGLAVYRAKRVLEVVQDPEEQLLQAWVQGTQSIPYDVTVFLDDEESIVQGECSCPVGYNCKHAVAAFLEFREHQQADGYQPGGRPVPGTSGTGTKRSIAPSARERLDEWLRRLGDAGPVGSANGAPSSPQARHGAVRHRLYALEPAPPGGPVNGVVLGASLGIREATRAGSGFYNRGRRHDPDGYYADHDTVVDGHDAEILGCAVALASQAGYRWYGADVRYPLTGRLGALLLERALTSGRTFLGDDRRQPLQPGPPIELALDWRTDDSGARSLRASAGELPNWWALATDPPMYLDPASRRIGPLLTGLSGAQLLVALDAPQVPDTELQRFGEALESLQAERPRAAPSRTERSEAVRPTAGGDPAPEGGPGAPPALIPLPVELDGERITDPPVFAVCLHSLDGDPHVNSWAVTVLARYGDVALDCSPFSERGNVRIEREDGSSVRVQRDLYAEHQRLREFADRFAQLTPGPASLELPADPDRRDVPNELSDPGIVFRAVARTPADRFRQYRQLVGEREALERDGWELIVVPPVHTDVIRPSSFQGLVERDENEPGWFDLSLGFEHEGVRHELMPMVIAWLERGGGDEPVLVEQSDGRFLEVPAAALRPVAAVFEELGEGSGERATIRLSRARALALETLQQALGESGIDTDWHGDREPIEFARRLRTLADIDTSDFANTSVPRALRATLRPYQRAGLGWLNALATHDLCGILADDMGLGKTVQTIAHLLWLRSARRLDGPALVVAPTSLLGNWAREAAQFAPRLKVRVWHGGDRHELPLALQQPQADLVITSYGLALRDRDLLAEHGFGMLVLDEAQQIKNPAAKMTRAVKSLPIQRRLCLSGTPLENHLGELWSQFDFLMPGLLGEANRFTRHYRTPIERHGDDERRLRLAEAVRPFLLRRRKEAVASDLPAKTEMVREVRLAPAQEKLYESIRVAMQERVREALANRGVAQSQITVLDSLLKLRQLCCHPEIVKLPSARKVKESAKTGVLLDMLDEMIAEGRRVLVFSQFTSMLTIIERELAKRDIAWVKLTGRTRRRDEAIDRFQRGEVPLFLISLKAGGTGLNLTAADTVIHYDPWWNPAAEDQASARAHRIGQDKPVFVYRLVTAGTVEQRIVELQARKRQLADGVLERSDAGALASMSAEQTLSLFDEL